MTSHRGKRHSRIAKRHWRVAAARIAVAASITLAAFPSAPAFGQNTVYFSVNDAGQTKSVAEWGVDTAWPSNDNVRQSILNIGAANVDVVRLNFYPEHALVTNTDGTFSLNTTTKNLINTQLSLASQAGANKPLALLPTVGTTASMYKTSATEVNVDAWAQLIKTTQEYINSRPGFTTAAISSIEAFNEPDYWQGQGTPANLNSVIQKLKTYSVFQNTTLLAGSTLSSDAAQYWYDRAPAATVGSSHLLGGSLTSYVNFMDAVRNNGKPFANPELHSLGEAIVGAEHGMTSGIWWADVLRARGLFVQASDGKRLGYAQDLARQSAAAVYRAPSGKVYAFAGGVERFGRATAYRFVSTDQDVCFNGIPVREYMIQTKFDQDGDFEKYGSWSNQGAYADIDTDGSSVPALDGYRWKIMNTQTGQIMEVAGSGLDDGALIRSAADGGGLNQQWNIIRTRNGYYELFNANSGRTVEVANGSLNNGASVRQYGTADNQIQQWTIEPDGTGSFYIRNAYSNRYLTSSATNSTQSGLTGSGLQKWKFVIANPTGPAKARYDFQGNANSSVSALHGTPAGTPTYGNAPATMGQALTFSGDDSVQLPSGIANSADITISAAVKWDGGANWQRIFDFGNSTSSYMFLTPKSGDGTMRFSMTTAGNDNEQFLDTGALPIGQWVYLTVTLGGNTGILYVNGKPQVAGQMLLNPSDINPTLNYLGKSQFPDALFRGMIDDFQIYDYALDQTQVANLVPRIWNGDANGAWAASTSWTFANVPNGAGQTVNFAGPTTAVRTATLSAPTRVGTLNFSSAPGMVLAGTGSLTLDSLSGPAQINVTAGSPLIGVPLSFADNALINVASGALLESSKTLDAGTNLLTKTGTGGLQVAQLRNARLEVQAGTVRIAPHTASSVVSGASKLTSLTIAAGATLDLTNNALAIDYDTASAGTLLTDIRSHLAAGRLTGAATDTLAIGYADNSTLHRTTLDGLGVDDTSILLQLCLKGDTDLTGGVTFDDLLALARNYNGADKVWSQGDFDYDGSVDFDDLLALARNYNQSLSPANAATVGTAFAADFAMAQAMVPEPTVFSALLAGAVGVTARRRRR